MLADGGECSLDARWMLAATGGLREFAHGWRQTAWALGLVSLRRARGGRGHGGGRRANRVWVSWAVCGGVHSSLAGRLWALAAWTSSRQPVVAGDMAAVMQAYPTVLGRRMGGRGAVSRASHGFHSPALLGLPSPASPPLPPSPPALPSPQPHSHTHPTAPSLISSPGPPALSRLLSPPQYSPPPCLLAPPSPSTAQLPRSILPYITARFWTRTASCCPSCGRRTRPFLVVFHR